jgi:hypothetical protein
MKIVPVLLAAAFALALFGCSDNKSGDAKPAGSGAPAASAKASGSPSAGW